MTARLLACPSCARHIRVDETRCPFCGVACPDAFASSPAPVPPPSGLSRAERYGYAARMVGGGALVASTLTMSCSSGDMVTVEYGGACTLDDGSCVAYETPPFDGSTDSEASAPLDAGTEATESDDGDSDAGDAEPDATPDAPPPSDAGDGG